METPPASDEPIDPGARRRARLTAGAVLGVIAVFWIAAFAGWGKRDSPDVLSDTAWRRSARKICADTEKRLSRLPNAGTATSPEDRSLQIVRSDRDLQEMLDKLAALPVDNSRDADTIRLWLKDYRGHLSDRRKYAATLAKGVSKPFTETTRANKALSKYIDQFASTNRIPLCATPDDV